MRAAINQQLVETGEREKLKELLRVRLAECGWRDELKKICKDIVRERGLEHVTVDDLVKEITPQARQLVPDSVKKELLHRIRTFLAQHANLWDKKTNWSTRLLPSQAVHKVPCYYRPFVQKLLKTIMKTFHTNLWQAMSKWKDLKILKWSRKRLFGGERLVQMLHFALSSAENGLNPWKICWKQRHL